MRYSWFIGLVFSAGALIANDSFAIEFDFERAKAIATELSKRSLAYDVLRMRYELTTVNGNARSVSNLAFYSKHGKQMFEGDTDGEPVKGVFDGKKALALAGKPDQSTKQTAYVLSIDRATATPPGLPEQLNMEAPLIRALTESDGSGTLEMRESADLISVDITLNGYLNSYEIAKSPAIFVRSFNGLSPDGQTLGEMLSSDPVLVNGFAFPKSVNLDNYAEGKLSGSISFRLLDFDTDPSSLPDSLFSTKLPKDIVVYDKDAQVWLRDDRAIESWLKQSLKGDGLSRRWFLIGSLLLFGAVLALLTWYRRN